MSRNYFKSSVLVTVLIFLPLGSSALHANPVSISSDGTVTYAVLPESLCDISDNYEGQILFDFLAKAKTRDKSSLMPEALSIIGKCNAYENALYPWGYIAVLPNDKYSNTRKKYNNLAEEVFGSQQTELGEVLNDVIKDMDMSSMIKEDYGLNMEQLEIGKFKVIKVTDSAVHILAITSFELNGIKLKGMRW